VAIWITVILISAAAGIILYNCLFNNVGGILDIAKSTGMAVASLFLAGIASGKLHALGVKSTTAAKPSARIDAASDQPKANATVRKTDAKDSAYTSIGQSVIGKRNIYFGNLTNEEIAARDLVKRFVETRDVSLAYKMGLLDLATPFMGMVGKPPFGFAFMLPYAIAVQRNGGRLSSSLDWPDYGSLGSMERDAVALLFRSIYGSTEFLFELLDMGVSVSIWEACFMLQEGAAKHWGLEGHPSTPLFDQIYRNGGKLPKIERLYGVDRLGSAEDAFAPHLSAVYVTTGRL